MDPVETPSALRMNEITVTEIACITPLVVRVLLAQRRLALVASRTIAMQSSAVEVSTAWSTRDWGVMTGLGTRLISGHPRRWCSGC
jgi:hypothetical protein